MDLSSIPTRLLDTLVHQRPPHPPTAGSGSSARRSFKPQVQVVDAGRARQSDETRLLLRRRLLGGLLVTAIEMFIALLTTLTLPMLGIRVAVLMVIIVCNLIARRFESLSLNQLRWIELATLGSFAVQCTTMPIALMIDRAWAGDPITVTMDKYFALGAWAVALLSYGLLIPNTTRRAATVILPLALVPDLSFYLLGRLDPMVAKVYASLHHGPPFPIVLVGAVGGIYGAHLLHSMRRDEFQAKQFGRYVIGERLGAGGMGEVFRAEHDLLKRPCALKLINRHKAVDPSAVSRFEREVQATARLTHPSAIQIYDYGQTQDGDFYYVMELLDGMSLHDLIARTGPMPAARAVHLLRQICGALKEAHGQGLIHRDIKPANIFAARQGGLDDVAKLLDFGLVRFTQSSADLNLTQFGTACGSPPYMSPEQANASENLDGRGDLYALGAVAYFLVTGRPTYTGKTSMDILVALTRDPVVPPSTIQPDVPADLEAVILRCLEKKADDRYADAQALSDALGRCRCSKEWSEERARDWWDMNLRVMATMDQRRRDPTLLLQVSESEFMVPHTADQAPISPHERSEGSQ